MRNYIESEQSVVATQKRKALDEAQCRKKAVLHRMYIVSGICLVCFTVVLGRAVYLHLADNEDLKWIADKQYNARVDLSARRGKIFDRHGSEMAVSLPIPSIYADPEFIGDAVKTAKSLAKILNVNENKLLSRLKGTRRFAWLKRRVSHDVLKKVVSLNLPGIGYIEESKRFYPNGELASQILGAVGYDSQALAGIELAYSDVLISKKKSISYKRDARGKLYAAPLSFDDQSDIGTIYLTLDKKIQFVAESALRAAVKQYNAAGGVAVVMDPTSGEILAMANAPVFDPNQYSKYPVENWRNRAVTDTFEPGSTFKVFVVASALNEGIINTESIFDCERGAIKIGGHIIKDHHPYDKLPVKDVIKYSSNICAMKIARDLGGEKLFNGLKGFSIGGATGVDFPGEIKGVLRNYKTWQPIEMATIAFGQGVTVTALQMAAAFSAVVNGGRYFSPRLVARIVDHNGEVIRHPEARILAHPVSEGTSGIMRYMLARVVEKGGTGTRAHSDAYTVGGKTGTAQKVAGGGGYAAGKYFASFVGFAPVEDPRVVAFVGIDEPKGSYYGGIVAAPAVKDILETSLRYLGVPSKNGLPVFDADQKNKAETEEVSQISNDEVGVEPKSAEFKETAKDRYVMPDLAGLTMRDVLVATDGMDLELVAEGSGLVKGQTPAPGSALNKGGKFSVRFELPR